MKQYNFPCGCKFDVIEETGDTVRIGLNPDLEELPLTCQRTWDFISSGDTKGVFQLEKQGHAAKKLQPNNMEHLSALIAIIRPGCAESIIDGKSVTQHYIDRKHGREEVTYYHPALIPALKSTYGLLVYQEQAMQIVKDIAGFNLLEADNLRKAIGKKKPEEMAKIKTMFLEKAKALNIVSEQEAIEIFSWIEKSQRYSFNKCLSPKTLVETTGGEFKTIEEVSIGETIKSPYGDTKILNKYDNGDKELFEIELESGKKIECTSDHQFVCEDGEKYPLWQILYYDLKILCQDDRVPYEKVVGVRTIGVERTVDIEVDNEQHVFYGNGIATSNSHSISYAYNAYLSAYCKAHFIRPFFTSYLFYSKDKAKQTLEIKELVNNAKMLNVVISTPDFRRLITASRVAGLNPSAHFMLRDKVVYVGFSDIKGVGEAAIEKLLTLVPFLELMLEKPYTEWDWTEFLLYCSPHLNSAVVKALIQAGTFSYMGLTRTRMIYEYDAFQKLSEKELLWVCEHRGPTLTASLQKMVDQGTGRDKGISNKNRLVIVGDIITSLDNPSYSMDDAADWIAGIEESLLGISITCTKVDGRDTASANCTCKEFADGKRGYVIIGAQITNVNEIKTKRGENAGQRMAFLTLSDTTGSLDNIVAFPDTWSECKGLLVTGNLILLGGERGKDNSLIVKKVWQM